MFMHELIMNPIFENLLICSIENVFQYHPIPVVAKPTEFPVGYKSEWKYKPEKYL